MIVVAGPRIDAACLAAPDGVEVRALVPNLDQHLAACDVALVQGGLTTCMELAAAGRASSILRCEIILSRIHVAHRLRRYGAGMQMDFVASTPETIADAVAFAVFRPNRSKPVEADGPSKTAAMISELL